MKRFTAGPEPVDPRLGLALRLILTAALTVLVLGVISAGFSEERAKIDWRRVTKARPDLKILVLVEGDRPISLQDLALLSDKGLIPADRDPGLVLGLDRAVFSTKINNWMSRRPLPAHLRARLLERFARSGIYRIGFKVDAENHQGLLNFEITAPRDGFGRKLLQSEGLVRPTAAGLTRVDSAGNRWFCVGFPRVEYGTEIRFHFAFKYAVDMGELLSHDLLLCESSVNGVVPADVAPFLRAGYKINARLPEAVAWAEKGKSPVNTVREYRRLTKFLSQSVAYDNRKRSTHFGGKSVYYDLDDMYRPVTETLSRIKELAPIRLSLSARFFERAAYRAEPPADSGISSPWFMLPAVAGCPLR